MSSSNVLGTFLQDVIGRDEVLTPTSGKLRIIHARIAKEVEDAKQELHSTVKQQWPTLKRQYNTTIDLTDRLKAISGEVTSLESELDGDDSALRPRLQASFAAHTQLSKRQKDSNALADLLESLKGLQDANAVVEELLQQGRLDEVVPALHASERLINVEIAEWKKDCQPFKTLKEQHEHSMNIAKERLEEALDRCIAFGDNELTLSTSTYGQSNTTSVRLGLQAILTSLASISPLDKHFERIAKTILKGFIKPVLVDGTHTIQLDIQESSQVLILQQQQTADQALPFAPLRAILQALRSSLASPQIDSSHRKLFLSFLIPPMQQILVDNVLVRSLPNTAGKAELDAFQKTCEAVSAFESDVLRTPSDPVEPVIQAWVQNAGTHWSNSIIQKCFAALRAEISTSEYWNKTESVDWVDDPTDEEDRAKWDKWLAESVAIAIPTPSMMPQPEASTSQLPALEHEQPARAAATSPIHELEMDEEEVAWDFDEEEAARNEEDKAESDRAAQAESIPRPKEVPESPNMDADDAWGFGEEDLVPDASPASQHTSDSPQRLNGHRKTLSKSSIRSRTSQKSSRSSKGKSAEQDDDDNDGGWSFDADDTEEDLLEADRTSAAEPTPSAETQALKPEGLDHSRNSSIEDAWGWSRNPDPDENKPIGKPTKVVVSKRLGAKGRTASLTRESSMEADHSESTSTSATPLASMPTTSSEKSLPVHAQHGESTSVLINEEPALQKKVQTKLLVSSRARTVSKVALELLEAALAVSSTSYKSVDLASASKRLLNAYSDLFDFYRAIMPVAHSELITTVPSIGMQFSNDCLYVARDGVTIATERLEKDLIGKEEKMQRRKPIEALRLYGQRVLEEQIDLQRVPLMETLDEADGFRNTDDPRAFAQCQRCVRQVVHTLTSVSHAWKPVLLKRVYFESLGVLVNAALLRVLVEIENQEDISEESSHRLNDLCKMLHELETLFMDGEQSTVALHVPVWFKFKFLSELLEASMADIMYLFNEGHLVDFSSTELSKLVRALFADSQLRQRNLESIARGH